MERCTVCHSLGRVESAQKSEAEWQSNVKRMVGKGAELTDQEQAAVVAFLTEPVDDRTLADVLFVRAQLQSSGLWSFDVTVQHEDIDWDHYADRWEVLAPDGEVLATRVLAHPHVDEQPFTRSQGGIVIPPEMSKVRVRAHDLVHGYEGREVVVDLATASGPDFEVLR